MVMIDGRLSKTLPIQTGVPQGSMLGPLLFSIYVNGLTEITTTASTLMYAEDTVINTQMDKKHTSTQLDQIQSYQNDLNRISNWCNNRKLSINSKKTKVMILGINSRNKQLKLPCPLSINGVILETVSKYKYLGLTLNGQLTLTDHCSKTIAMVS